MKFYIVEKNNTLAVHGIFNTLERAQRHLDVVIPDYCERKLFMDKTLQPLDFAIVGRV